MRIAHISDPHLVSLEGAVPWRLLNKRVTGWVNLRYRRSAVHRPDLARAVAAHLREDGVDHVVVTGDLTNLALEGEFRLGRALLDDVLGLGPDRVSVVPGNHDVYTRGSERARRFFGFFEPYLRSDLPDLRGEHPAGAFPYVKLRGPVAIVGLATAVARPPLVAAGHLGRSQLLALARILEHPEVRRRTPVLCQHHPPLNPSSPLHALLEGLRDAPDLARVLGPVSRGLVLHGHLHRRLWRRLRTDAGWMDVVGATSVTLARGGDDRVAGYNLYDVGDDGAVRTIEAWVLDRSGGPFRRVDVPSAPS